MLHHMAADDGGNMAEIPAAE